MGKLIALTNDAEWTSDESESSQGTLISGATSGRPQPHDEFGGEANHHHSLHVEEGKLRRILVLLYSWEYGEGEAGKDQYESAEKTAIIHENRITFTVTLLWYERIATEAHEEDSQSTRLLKTFKDNPLLLGSWGAFKARTNIFWGTI